MKRLMIGATLFELSLAVAALGVGALVGYNPLQSPVGIEPVVHAWVGIPAVLPPIGLFLLFLRSAWEPFRRIRVILARVLHPLLSSLSPPGAVALSIAAGIGEEVLFRGLILGGLLTVLGPVPALAFSSLLFGVVHWVTPAYAVYAGLFGLYLGGLHILTGTLFVPILVHALYDAVALILLSHRRNVSGL